MPRSKRYAPIAGKQRSDMPKKVIRSAGKNYDHWSNFTSKRTADSNAEKFRKAGYPAKVVRMPKGWWATHGVYVHSPANKSRILSGQAPPKTPSTISRPKGTSKNRKKMKHHWVKSHYRKHSKGGIVKVHTYPRGG